MIGFRRRPKPLEPGYHARLAAPDLLRAHGPTIHRIRGIVALDDRYWNALYQSVLNNTAEFCQQLPASEFHHHSEPGGLLSHTLDVIERALRYRRGYILPSNASAEEAAAEQDLWTYCVFTSAILHDLGKPITDQRIDLYDGAGKKHGEWNPWLGAIPGTVQTYRIRYHRDEDGKRNYHLHEKSALLLASRMIPDIGLGWISANRRAFAGWLNVLTGDIDAAGAVGEIVKRADMDSVAEYTGGTYSAAVSEETVKAAVTRNKPLSERLLTAFRQLLKTGELPLNRNGAAGWVAGDSLWMVSQRTLDEIKKWMLNEGQTGVPGQNGRLMDELLGGGVVVANGDRAIWTCRIQGRDWPKEHRLTMLRFPLGLVWPEEDARPPQFDCVLLNAETNEDLLGVAAGPTPVGSANTSATDAPVGTANSQPIVEHGDDSTSLVEPITEEQPQQSAQAIQPTTAAFGEGANPFDDLLLNMPPLANDSDAGSEPETLDRESTEIESPNAAPGRDPELPFPITEPSKQPGEPEVSVGSANTAETVGTTNTTEVAKTVGSANTPAKHGLAFLAWLRDGLRSRKFEINTHASMIHMVEEGMLLVSPAIFKRFARDDWFVTQKGFCRKVGVILRTAAGKNIHTYVVTGKKKVSRVKGILIPDISGVFPGIDLPAVNTFLIKEEFYQPNEKKKLGQI